MSFSLPYSIKSWRPCWWLVLNGSCDRRFLAAAFGRHLNYVSVHQWLPNEPLGWRELLANISEVFIHSSLHCTYSVLFVELRFLGLHGGAEMLGSEECYVIIYQKPLAPWKQYGAVLGEGSPKFWRAVLDMHDNRTLQPLVNLVERDLIERKR